jgi:hypothetical protein
LRVFDTLSGFVSIVCVSIAGRALARSARLGFR